MRIPERLTDLVEFIGSLPLEGRDVAVRHLVRTRDHFINALTRQVEGITPPENSFKEAVTEVRCAHEHICLCVARAFATARADPLSSEKPLAIRDRLVRYGILGSDKAKEIVDRVYGVGSEKSAHPGFSDQSEAEHQIGMLLDTTLFILRRYREGLERGFRSAAEPRDSLAEASQLARMLHARMLKDPRVTGQVVIDERGVRQVLGRVADGEPPIEFGLTTRSQEATEKLLRALQRGEGVSLTSSHEQRDFDLRFDERIASLIGFDPNQPVELTLRAQPGRHVRVVLGEGSPVDIPSAEFISLGLLPFIGYRFIIRSPHLACRVFIDHLPDAEKTRYTVEQIAGAPAQVHLRTLRLFRAAAESNAPVMLRTLPDDHSVLELPLKAMVAELPEMAVSDQTLRICELFARVERAIGRSLTLDRQWPEDEVVLVEQVDHFLTHGSTIIQARGTVQFEVEDLEQFHRHFTEPETGFILRSEDQSIFEIAGGTVSLGPHIYSFRGPVHKVIETDAARPGWALIRTESTQGVQLLRSSTRDRAAAHGT